MATFAISEIDAIKHAQNTEPDRWYPAMDVALSGNQDCYQCHGRRWWVLCGAEAALAVRSDE